MASATKCFSEYFFIYHLICKSNDLPLQIMMNCLTFKVMSSNDTNDIFAVIQVRELIFENGQKQIIHLAVTNLPSYPLILALWQATQLDKSTLFKNRLAINLWMTEERGWHSKRR